MTPRTRQRFERKVRVSSKPDECWIWTGATSSTGYGNFWVTMDGCEPAHRVAYRLFVGKIPAGRVVLHRCHKPLCVNPRHLHLGTAKTQGVNMARRLRSGTRKLSPSDIRNIKKAYLAGERQRDIAKRYGVAQTTVSAVCQHRSWQWMGLKAVRRRRNV